MALRFEAEEQCRAALGEISLGVLEGVLAGLWTRFVPDVAEPKVLEISLSIADPEKMRALNKRYRDIDEPTDVLAFPLWETADGLFSPPTGWPVLELGDVVVCPPKIAENAVSYGKVYEEELLLVLIHGVLHLFALDHGCEEGRAKMWKIQEDLVKACNVRKMSAPGKEE
ncbi:MAG: rRNA maturation RNase YbeY [Thermovirgaceae bacterium]